MNNEPELRYSPQFNRLVWQVAAFFGLLLIVLMGLNLLSGPRLRSANIDSAKATTQSGQRLILRANQPVAKVQATAIHIEPATPFSVTSTADTITINFKEHLHYRTSYTVSVSGVASISGKGKQTRISHTFSTPDPQVFYLKRAANYAQPGEQTDRIMQTSLYGTNTEVVFSAKKIIDYVAIADKLIVSSATGGDAGMLSLVDVLTKQVSTIKTPGVGIAADLRASNNGSTFGFTFSSPPDIETDNGYYDTLFVGDINPGFRATTVSGVGGKPISVEDWQFAPDGTSIIAHLIDQSLLLIDGNFKHAPVPLSSFAAISTFSPDGTKLLVKQRDDYAMLDLVGRKAEPVPLSALASTDLKTYLLEMLKLPSGDGYIQHYETDTSNQSRPLISFKLYQNSHKKTVYSFGKQSIAVYGIGVSPNGQILAAETTPEDKTDSDDYPAGTFHPLAANTELIDIPSGKVLKKVNGIKAVVH